jgi:predicted RNase H-like HicB family nuclease
MTQQFKIIVEKHSDGYVAYPLGVKGVVVGEGDTYEEALADVRSAIAFHIETFGTEVFKAQTLQSDDFLRSSMNKLKTVSWTLRPRPFFIPARLPVCL